MVPHCCFDLHFSNNEWRWASFHGFISHLYVFFGASLVVQTVKHLTTMRETQVQSLVGKSPWRWKWQPTPVLSPGKFHGLRSLVGYSPWGRKESDTTERLHFHFLSLSCLLWRTVYLVLLPTFWLDCLFFWYWAAWAACIFWRLILSLQADSLPSEPPGKPKRKVNLRRLPVGSGGLWEGREGEDSKVSKLVWGHICACGLRWGTQEKLVSGWRVVMYSQGRQKWDWEGFREYLLQANHVLTESAFLGRWTYPHYFFNYGIIYVTNLLF